MLDSFVYFIVLSYMVIALVWCGVLTIERQQALERAAIVGVK